MQQGINTIDFQTGNGSREVVRREIKRLKLITIGEEFLRQRTGKVVTSEINNLKIRVSSEEIFRERTRETREGEIEVG